MNKSQIDQLIKIAGQDRICTNQADLMCYAYDSSLDSQLNKYMPDAVFTPREAEDIPAVVAYCNGNNISITARGAGTGQCGGSVAPGGGLVIDMSALNRIVEVDTDNLQVIVETGVVHADLNQQLASLGFS
ncbi:MAG: putative FAD-linked oxidoreductase, partial [Sporomusa sp.]|nr:putative FAD-linked oxidoreductase [Sporomusa sp.]